MSPAVHDPGLQLERTVLAWQRTSLATAAAGLAVARLAMHRSALPALVVALFATTVAGLTMLQSLERYRSTSDRLAAQQPISTSGPTLPATLAITLLGVAVMLTAPAWL